MTFQWLYCELLLLPSSLNLEQTSTNLVLWNPGILLLICIQIYLKLAAKNSCGTADYSTTVHSFQHLCVHVFLLAEFLLLLLLHDAVLFACNPPCRVLHDINDVVQSLLVRADGPHTFGTQFPIYLLPNLPCLQWHRIQVLDLTSSEHSWYTLLLYRCYKLLSSSSN